MSSQKKHNSNKKILFIAAHRFDRAPGQRFRFEQYFQFLKQNGFDCELSYIISEADDKILYSPGNYFQKIRLGVNAWIHRAGDVLTMNNYDIIFIFREAFMTGSIFFEKLFKKSNAKLVFDFDDAIWLPVVSDNNRFFSMFKDATKTSKIIGLCDLVFAGNQYLADYARQFNKNTVVIPTTIDTETYTPAYSTNTTSAITIGWSGSVSTIQHFQHAIPPLRILKEKYPEKVAIKVIGDPNYVHHELGIRGMRWNAETEVNDLQEIDIGIMPLPDDEWTKGKCGLKGLQYMALEIPTVMSPVGVNTKIIDDGVNGFLAGSLNEWVDKLTQLLENPELRLQLGKNGRKTVEENYSVISQRNRYLAYFNQLTQR